MTTRWKWSKNFDDYAAGRIDASEIICVKCDKAPCKCSPCPSCASGLA